MISINAIHMGFYMVHIKVQQIMKSVKKRAEKAWAPTLVISVLLLLNYYLFGRDNILIGTFMTLTFLKIRNDDSRLGNLLKKTGIYLVITILAFLAMKNLAFCLISNGVAILWIGAVLVNRYEPTNYIPYGLALMFYQIVPVSLGRLPMRLLSVVFSAMVVYAALLLIYRKRPLTRLSEFANNGMNAAAGLFEVLLSGDGDRIEAASEALTLSTCHLSEEIFSYNRNSLFNFGSAAYYFEFVVSFSDIISLKDPLLHVGAEPDQDEQVYFSSIGAALRGASTAETPKEKYKMALALSELAEKCPLRDEQQNYYVSWILNSLVKTMFDITRARWKSRKPSPMKWRRPKMRNRLAIEGRRLTTDSFRVRFALRLFIVMIPSFAFAYLSGFDNAYWLPMSLFLLVMPLYDNTTKRTGERVFGTIIGLLACFIIFTIFPSVIAYRAVTIISNFLIYASDTYLAIVTFTTCMVLSMKESPDTYMLLAERLIYTFLAAVAALIANRFVFPTSNENELKTTLSRLILIDYELTQELLNIKSGNEDTWLIRELILRSYLVAVKLQEHWDKLNAEDSDLDMAAFMRINNQFVTRIAHVYTLLVKKKPGGLYREEINQVIQRICQSLDCARLAVKGNDKSKADYYKKGKNDSRLKKIINEDSYLNTNLYMCERYADEMLDIVAGIKR